MKRLPLSFVVVVALASCLILATTVSAEEYEVKGTIKAINKSEKSGEVTFDLDCTSGKPWPGISVRDEKLIKSLPEWKTRGTVLTVTIDRKGKRDTAIAIRPLKK
jgi:hypothetical protein